MSIFIITTSFQNTFKIDLNTLKNLFFETNKSNMLYGNKLRSPARYTLIITSVLIGVIGCAVRPWPLALLAVALSIASSLNYILYTGEFTMVSAVDFVLAILTGCIYTVCMVGDSCWLGIGALILGVTAYKMRRHPDEQVIVHVFAIASLIVIVFRNNNKNNNLLS